MAWKARVFLAAPKGPSLSSMYVHADKPPGLGPTAGLNLVPLKKSDYSNPNGMLEYLEYSYSQMLKLNALKSYNLCGSSLVRLYIMQAKSNYYNVKHSDNQRYIRPQPMRFQLSVKLCIKTGST